ncbi:MAG: GPR1/FUN34/YaaH family transporter [Actinobacteria bacterium]|jgi:succinate-acetate transporter protein|nr:GPR1/FUN34/YaaH family transporter [Actinomycetota bacterium]
MSSAPYQQAVIDPRESLQEQDATRIVLRPIASPLPLGFLGLVVGSLLISALQLHWVPAAQRHELAIGLLAFTVPVQLIACLYGFLCRDVVASTGLGVLGGTWATLGVSLLTSPSGTTDPGLGIMLVVAAGALLVPATAALTSKVVATLVLVLAAARFAITGGYELTGAAVWQYASGVCGIVVAGVAVYAALAAEVDSATRRSVLPMLRPAHGQRAISGRLPEQVETLGREAGVREQL